MTARNAPYQIKTARERYLDGNSIKLLLESDAVESVTIIADQAGVYVHYQLYNGEHGTLLTRQRQLKNWATIDSAVKWLKPTGFGKAKIIFSAWPIGQRKLAI